jgi:glycosyltransferase involved in cell wall biosynthesis
MKILFFMDSLVSGGKERRLIELMRTLKYKKDIEFELIIMNEDIHYKEVFDLGINIHFIIRKTKKDISVFSRFYKLCQIYRPDIVHCWDSMTAVYSVPACKLLNIKLVNGMVINSPVRQNILNKLWLRARLTFPFSDVIVGNSKAGLKAYKAPLKKSLVIYNGFNFDRTENLLRKNSITELLKTGSCYIIGMVAAFSPSKDYKTFYEAAKILLDNRNDVIFIAIGPDTDSRESKELIGNKYIDSFRLLGLKSGIESYINVMDICVLSTFTEGVSNSILEYMALAKPVVASFGGGTNEIVNDNETGFLISTSNPKELAERLEILLKDVDLRTRMGTSGKRRVIDLFSVEQMVEKYYDLYKFILSVKSVCCKNEVARY